MMTGFKEHVKEFIRKGLLFAISPVEAGQESFCRSSLAFMQELRDDIAACENELSQMTERICVLEKKLVAYGNS